MASRNHDEDVDVSMIVDDEKRKTPVPFEELENDVGELGEAAKRSEENEKEEDLGDDLFAEHQGSDQRDEAQQQSSSSTIRTKTAETYEIKTDQVGNVWFCAAGEKTKTVYHSDIRYDLEHYAERSIPRGGPRYKSKLGAGTDDITSYHPVFDFCGKERDDRPDCLFYFKKPSTTQEKPTNYLMWNDRVVLDHRGIPIRDLVLPLTISSKIGEEEARLEAMLRSNTNIRWGDILARIFRRGDTLMKIRIIRNQLNMRLVRFHVTARLISWNPKSSSEALETCLLSIMTAEMIAKNSTKGLPDLVERSDERAFIDLMNYEFRKENSLAQGNEDSKQKKTKQKSKTKEDLEKERVTEEKRIEKAKSQLSKAEKWAQALSEWEVQNPIPAPSIYGEMECDAIESIVAFKLASLNQHRRDGSMAFEGSFMIKHAAPAYQFDNPRMEVFFGSQAHCHNESLLSTDPNDPYGILSSPTVTAAQTCVVDVLLEPARLQYRKAIMVVGRFGAWQPIFTTNPNKNYWQQLETLQNAFEQHWTEVGHGGRPPTLYGLLKVDYDSMTWNAMDIPNLAVVWQNIDSANRNFAHWQHRQIALDRAKLVQRQRELDDEEKKLRNAWGHKDNEGQDKLRMEKEKDVEEDAVIEEGGPVEEDVMEVEREGEEEL